MMFPQSLTPGGEERREPGNEVVWRLHGQKKLQKQLVSEKVEKLFANNVVCVHNKEPF